MILNDEKIEKLRRKINLWLTYSLLERAPKKMRGVTVDLKEDLIFIFFFDDVLTEDEEEDIDLADTDLCASLWGDYLGVKFRYIGHRNCVVDSSLSIIEKVGNLGWFYLRHEY